MRAIKPRMKKVSNGMVGLGERAPYSKIDSLKILE